MVLAAPGGVNIPCLMHDTCLCQIDVEMKNKLAWNIPDRCKFITCHDVKIKVPSDTVVVTHLFVKNTN